MAIDQTREDWVHAALGVVGGVNLHVSSRVGSSVVVLIGSNRSLHLEVVQQSLNLLDVEFIRTFANNLGVLHCLLGLKRVIGNLRLISLGLNDVVLHVVDSSKLGVACRSLSLNLLLEGFLGQLNVTHRSLTIHSFVLFLVLVLEAASLSIVAIRVVSHGSALQDSTQVFLVGRHEVVLLVHGAHRDSRA
jgi:hypothetical protein